MRTCLHFPNNHFKSSILGTAEVLCPILGDASHQSMIEFLTRLPAQLKKPDAIIVVSAHWEEPKATLLGAEKPPMFYDYYGFPDEAYAIQYPAPGSPDLAQEMADLLIKNDIPVSD